MFYSFTFWYNNLYANCSFIAQSQNHLASSALDCFLCSVALVDSCKYLDQISVRLAKQNRIAEREKDSVMLTGVQDRCMLEWLVAAVLSAAIPLKIMPLLCFVLLQVEPTKREQTRKKQQHY